MLEESITIHIVKFVVKESCKIVRGIGIVDRTLSKLEQRFYNKFDINSKHKVSGDRILDLLGILVNKGGSITFKVGEGKLTTATVLKRLILRSCIRWNDLVNDEIRGLYWI